MKKRYLAFLSVDWYGYDAGVAILDPAYHNYNDLFNDGVVLTVYFTGAYASRITQSKIRYDEKTDQAYFNKYGQRHYLENMPLFGWSPSYYSLLV